MTSLAFLPAAFRALNDNPIAAVALVSVIAMVLVATTVVLLFRALVRAK